MKYDYIVVGAGVTGSWTACILAQEGRKVLLLEQFPLPHTRGSSHGQSRGIRLAYINPTETAMAKMAYAHWEYLQKIAEDQIIIPCSLLTVAAPANYDKLEAKDRSLQQHLPGNHDVLNGQELRDVYPKCFRFPLDYKAILDHKAGILRPDKSLKALQRWLVQLGGQLVDDFKVSSILPGPPVRVVGSKGTYLGEHLLICAGPWSNDVLSLVHLKLPLTPVRVVAPYYKIKEGYSYPMNTFSFTGVYRDDRSHFYSMPAVDYPGMIKVAPHRGIPVHPEQRDTVDVSKLIEETSEHVREHWPGLHPEPALVEYCMYTMTPDDCMILDKHPQYPHIAFACGLSGTGFKMGPAIGQIFHDFYSGKEPSLDATPLKLDRFNSTAKL